MEMMVCRQIQNYGRSRESIYWENSFDLCVTIFASLANVAVWNLWSAGFWKGLSPSQSAEQFLVNIPNNHVHTIF